MGLRERLTAPSHLAASTREWWDSTAQDFALEPHHERLLLLALEHWDRAAEARQALADHGLVFEDRFGSPKPRPEVQIARDSSLACARLLREIGLDGDLPDPDPRLPRRDR